MLLDTERPAETWWIPAVSGLHVSTRMILAAGLEAFLAHRGQIARGFRRGCSEVLKLPLVSPRPSNAFTTARLPSEIRGQDLQALLTRVHSIGIPILRLPDGDECLAIGHAGWVFRDDIFAAISAIAVSLEVIRLKGGEAVRELARTSA